MQNQRDLDEPLGLFRFRQRACDPTKPLAIATNGRHGAAGADARRDRHAGLTGLGIVGGRDSLQHLDPVTGPHDRKLLSPDGDRLEKEGDGDCRHPPETEGQR
ncbi:hypothetical protein ACRBEV_27760 [Methylobacterium phyllosphaerae]